MSAFTINTTCEGNLTDEPTLRETSDGTPVANFRIAVTSRVKAGDEYVDRTEFINVVAWRDLGVNAAASLHKGNRVIVSGDLRQRSFEGRDGETRYVTEVTASMVGVSLRWHVVAGVEKAKDALQQESIPA